VRHQRSGKKLGRDSAHRRALYANLAGALIENGRIRTTVTKARAVKPIAEQMITLGRRGDLHARRQATAFLRSRDVVHLLFAEVAPRFQDRPGGYTRIVRIGPRPGDAAEMAYLELVDDEYVAEQREARSSAPDVAEEAAVTPPAAGEIVEDDEPEADEAGESETVDAAPAVATEGDVPDEPVDGGEPSAEQPGGAESPAGDDASGDEPDEPTA
jgi:large subunit ribosomal protein L17